MKRIFIMLLFLTGIGGQAAHAGDPPADGSDTIAQPDDTTQGPDGGSTPPEEGKGKGTAEGDEEPDCE